MIRERGLETGHEDGQEGESRGIESAATVNGRAWLGRGKTGLGLGRGRSSALKVGKGGGVLVQRTPHGKTQVLRQA